MQSQNRFVLNRFRDYEQALNAGETIESVQASVRLLLTSAKAELMRKYPPSSSMEISSLPTQSKPDFSIYTGCGGNIVVHSRLQADQSNSNSPAEVSEHVEAALRTALGLTTRLRSDSASFFLGAAGIYALATGLDPGNRQRHVESLMNQNTPELTEDDEVLYGKAGFLYCLLLAQYSCPELRDQLRSPIEEVAETLFETGLRISRNRLTFTWCNTHYLGAAHGLTGILQMLTLCVRENEDWIFRERNTFNDYKQVLLRSFDYLCDLQFPSGNFPVEESDAGEPGSDKLVHFCHGNV